MALALAAAYADTTSDDSEKGDCMAILTKEDVLNAPDIREKVVEVPEWGGSVKVKTFTRAQHQVMRERAVIDGVFSKNRYEMLMFVEGVVEPKFTESDVEAILQKSSTAVGRVMEEILSVIGAGPEGVASAQMKFPVQS